MKLNESNHSCYYKTLKKVGTHYKRHFEQRRSSQDPILLTEKLSEKPVKSIIFSSYIPVLGRRLITLLALI